MQQLSGGDALFLKVEMDNCPMHIGGVSIYDQSTAPGGKVRFKNILKTFASRLDRSAIFRRKLLHAPMNMDQPYWIDDEDFDLEFHVRHIALPKPGDWRQLCIQVARLHARPLDQSHPLWEAYIIEGLNHIEGVPAGSFAVYIKAHHCALDGITGLRFFGAINDITAEPPALDAADWKAKPKPSYSQLMGKAYLNRLRRSYDIVKLAGKIGPTRKRLQQARDDGKIQPIDSVPATRFNEAISPHRVLDAVKFDFEAIRQIKNSVPGTTINDAVLAIISGAMRKYLNSHGELPDEPLVTGCPIDVRDESNREAAGNMIGMMSVSLRSDIDDAHERFVAIHQAAQSAKNQAEALGPGIAMEIAETVPTGIQSAVIRLAVSSGMAERNAVLNTIITNVPGSPVQLYLCGARQVDAIGLGPIAPGTALFHTVNSLVLNKKGSITISFVACRDAMPDPAFYSQCLEESYQELKSACEAQAGE